jgi:aspartate/glutamate racemase
VQDYYHAINAAVAKELGDGGISSKLVLYSLNLKEYASHANAGRFDDLIALVVDGARRLRAAGADFLVVLLARCLI